MSHTLEFESVTAAGRAIYNESDLESFKASDSCANILKFVQVCADAVVGKTITGEDYVVKPAIVKLQGYFERLAQWIDEIPPLKQPMRFGNKAFRIWHEKLTAETPTFIRQFLQEEVADQESIREQLDEIVSQLSVYIIQGFGNEIRIDYGTGHELNITVFFLCLYKLQIISQLDLSAVVLRAFTSYVKTMRKLQVTYKLEPAGSHGVWVSC